MIAYLSVCLNVIYGFRCQMCVIINVYRVRHVFQVQYCLSIMHGQTVAAGQKQMYTRNMQTEAVCALSPLPQVQSMVQTVKI